ncbi:disintegrin and metalloproteinase domain-containing protein 10-like [Babylonia areolata]|uniref:disintegrin and metalloproteinase domain-containing protein 10-like n=1 Tax=Babylonia areolata TaxID=304850 RepID=UPI003FD623A4
MVDLDRVTEVTVGLFVLAVLGGLAECGPLNDYILDYQPLSYDRNSIHRNHQRVRRSADSHFDVRFTAFGKRLRVKLWPSHGEFSPNHQLFTEDKGLHRPQISFLYHGYVTGEAGSRAMLAVHNGSLEGKIQTADTTFHIEPAAKYIPHPPFHTIIYPETHLNPSPYRNNGSACGVDHHGIREFMDMTLRLQQQQQQQQQQRGRTARGKRAAGNRSASDKHSHGQRSRRRRSLGKNNTCPLHLRADPLLFHYFKTTKHGTTVPDSQAEDEILAFFSSHVSVISEIYKQTVFQTYSGDIKNTGLSFVIHRTTIMKNCDQKSAAYCRNTLDVSNYLLMVSKENSDLFCLAFTFTYRDFAGGVVGLAWVAKENQLQAGLCGRYHSRKSLNTGIVSIINYRKVLPSIVSQLVFAHEVGHTFGSPHDIGSDECAPFGTTARNADDGNYIMYPYAMSGTRRNNVHFSPCSRDNMSRIIQQVVDSERHTCFVPSGEAFCGNKITEEGEECDCGFGTCSAATCCVGRDEDDPTSGCHLTKTSLCSPVSGPCCQDDCTFYLSGSFVCDPATECTKDAFCDGQSFTCPKAVHVANGTFCNDYSNVCEMGVALNKKENFAFKHMLLLAAQGRANSTSKTLPLAVPLPPGSPCDDLRGYCDVFAVCQRIDSEGPFEQLADIIFDPISLKKVRDWIVDHWWGMLLICIGAVVFMALLFLLFDYDTPTERPPDPGPFQDRMRMWAQERLQRIQNLRGRLTDLITAVTPGPHHNHDPRTSSQQ